MNHLKRVIIVLVNLLVITAFIGSILEKSNRIQDARLINSVDQCLVQGNSLKDYWDSFAKLENQLVIDSILQSFDKFAQERDETLKWVNSCGRKYPTLNDTLKSAECLAEGNQLKEYWDTFKDTSTAFMDYKKLTLEWINNCNRVSTVLVSRVLQSMGAKDLPETL